ncbi:DNA polymerase III subunit alpha [Candidatus Microgenomates bacterium]|nr:DNA polymerase III subunit alpha [Candidatus Microgenomates bacterium]
MADFVHLHNHSEFSLLDGLSKIPEMVRITRELGMKALAITDHGSLYGAFKFSNVDGEQNHLILLAKNNAGYKNLMKLSSISHLEGFYYKPRIDLELLQKYSEGLICLTACLNGYVSEPLVAGQTKEAYQRAEKLSDIFKEDLYLELQKHPNIKEQDILNERLIAMSKDLGLPLVATNDCHYIHAEDAQAQETLLCIQTQTTVNDENRKLSMIGSPDFYLRSPTEMAGLFIQYPEAIENTVKIAEKVNIEIETGKWIIPKFTVPEEKSADDYLRDLVYKNLPDRYLNTTPEIKERVEYELSVIFQKTYTTYFLIVEDLKRWAREQGIAAGPGRGSVAGSIVSYILKITELDPLKYGLPFERFLNPQRPTPPDFDLDFADDRRDEVIDYVTKKYGRDKVAQIITFGTMEARGSVRDVGRALGMPYSAPDRISKMIPPGALGFAMTIDKAINTTSELAYAYKTEPETQRLLDLARKLEGVARHVSTHAAGVVISDKLLTEYTPLQKETKGERIITQYDMYCLDLNVSEQAIGLLKIDFLGLRNLTILENAIGFVKENRGEILALDKILLDDKKVFDLITSGETTGIFQLESAGMRRLAKDLKPSKITDLFAMVALFRPGPMAWIDDFITAKNHKRTIKYAHPILKEILEETYGIALYQEQCMQIANAMAGYSLSEADSFRKAIGKKKPELMKKEKEKFIRGCAKNGYTEEVAENVFSLIEKFVGYGFNKAHSASYGLISYQTAYMKVNYPVEFMTAVLTAESRASSGTTKDDKIARAVLECKRLRIPVLPPDVNLSQTEFTIEDKTKIRFGLSAIKNVGEAAISSILLARQSGPFSSLADFINRVDLSKVNKKTLESLIKAGAMDAFGKRAVQLSSLSENLSNTQKEKKRQTMGQESLFGDDHKEENRTSGAMSLMEEFTRGELLAFERELLGFYLTEHPLERLISQLRRQSQNTISQLHLAETDQKKIRICGIISSLRKFLTKKSQSEMAFLRLEDQTSEIECVVFPKVYSLYKDILFKDQIVIVEGRLDNKEDRLSLIIETIAVFPQKD